MPSEVTARTPREEIVRVHVRDHTEPGRHQPRCPDCGLGPNHGRRHLLRTLDQESRHVGHRARFVPSPLLQCPDPEHGDFLVRRQQPSKSPDQASGVVVPQASLQGAPSRSLQTAPGPSSGPAPWTMPKGEEERTEGLERAGKRHVEGCAGGGQHVLAKT